MNRRGFLASMLGVPAALLAGLRRPHPNWTKVSRLLGKDGSQTLEAVKRTAAELAGLRMKLYRTDPRQLSAEQRITDEARGHPFSKIMNAPTEKE